LSKIAAQSEQTSTELTAVYESDPGAMPLLGTGPPLLGVTS
jgi:hypothetical protein